MVRIFSNNQGSSSESNTINFTPIGLCTWGIQFLSNSLRNSINYVRDAVFGSSLQSLEQESEFRLVYASDELRQNRDIVLAALNQNSGFSLTFASDELRLDRNIVLAAVRNFDRASELYRLASGATEINTANHQRQRRVKLNNEITDILFRIEAVRLGRLTPEEANLHTF